MADQPDEPVDPTDLPLPSSSNAPTEKQGTTASTSAMPLAEPTTTAPKSKAQRQREYRQRIAASRTPEQAAATKKSNTERQRDYRLRKAANLAIASGSLESTTASTSRSGKRSNNVQTGTQQELTAQQRQFLAAEPAQTTIQPVTSSDQIEVQQAQSTWNTKWASSIMRFKSTFLDNDFGYACSVCDRLWFKNDLKPITAAQLKVISDWFIKENRQLCREEYTLVCNTCKRTLNKKSMPPLAKVNGFSYPDRPPGLPPLDPISERLISPRLPFMQVRRLRHDFSYGIIGQVINVPVDVQEMVKCLPRQLNEDDVINVNIKRNLAHKSIYLSGYMSKSTIKAWLDVLLKSPLYRLYEINVDLSRLNPTMPLVDDIQDDPSNRIEHISSENTPESEILASRQHTMMWNEEDCLHIAPGHQTKPPNTIYDRHAEELSFPSIYFGEPRRFNMGVSVTPYMMATSEIRRRDRRGATPQKILYVAMKILRLRMVDGIYSTFRNLSVKENVTRRMLEDTEFMKEYVIKNLTFMKTMPNSVQYWASRKRDLFAMIRQLGKPTIFLTISANEIRWLKLLTILLKLSNKYPGKTAEDLDTSQRCTLVSDDPVTCCIYFYKLVGSLMKMLKSKQSYNPFDKYFVKDYFLRIEFQHSGSPHAHILLWLNDDPHETVSENMPRTIELVEKLSSVSQDDVPNNSIYATQIHKHTFTCTKRGETTCRFGIPYWPMTTTCVLVPMPQSDGRRQTLQQKAKELRTSLGERQYACMDDFLEVNGLTYASYLDIVRSTLRRPTLLFRRNFNELMTNTFNPYIAGEVNSNIDIQFILDEYSCAEYVVEYVNKSARGMGNLHRELTTMMQEHPEQDYTGQLKALSIKLLNAVEMSAQEAAWYLLRQPMSETSRHVVYIPTVWPTERQCCRKRRKQMDREGIDGDSTNVWTKNIIQRYEERPASLEQVYLAEFASWYADAYDFVDEEDDVHVDDDEDSENAPEARTSRAPKEYRRRVSGRIIRYRCYDIDEVVNYKREMVLLYVQFRNEMAEIVDQNKFLQLFDDNENTIMERRSLFETNLNIENVNIENENKQMSFFGYPKDFHRRLNWLVGREDLIERAGEYYRMCEQHFEKKNIKFTKLNTEKYLTDDAFPSLNLPSNTGASPSAAAQLFSQSSTDGSPHVFHQQNPGKNNANESMPMPIKLEIINDGSEFNDELEAYDRFSLLVSKKIKSIHSINARMRLMDAIQDMVDGFCAKNDHDPIDSSTHQTMSVAVVDGTESYDETHQVKQTDVIRSVHVQQLPIDPKPSSSFLPHEKKTIKTYSIIRKVMAEGNPIGESYVEVPVETALPTEFVESTKASTTEVQTITSRKRKKTNAQKCREYRERQKLQNIEVQIITAERSDECTVTVQIPAKKPKTDAERRKKYYEAQKLKKQKSKKIPKTAKQRNKEYYDRKKKKFQALNTLNHHSDVSLDNCSAKICKHPEEIRNNAEETQQNNSFHVPYQQSTKASTTEVQTITSRKRKKTNAQKCREYRERQKLQNIEVQIITAERSDECTVTVQIPAKKPKTDAERRKKKYYEAQKLKKQKSKKIPKTDKQRNKECYDRKKKFQALNTLNHHSDVSLGLKTDAPPLHGVGEARPNIDILEIKEEKIQDEESSSSMTTANESAAASVSGITFINDPIPIKLEVVEEF